ncbi:PaaI family thioesterase [Phascolarctobacterium faecium]|jgi:putative thioesterase domain protein|uniref:PaaI family thioesterase n=1 Tax=Phascolarctobacterium faecium TaxID=33025 RepID=UPI0026652E0F|nr:PaaI family thioesterase [Phascolarctobacterium faecium]
MNTVTDVADHIKQIWSSSAFMNLLKIEIDEIHCGGATVKMPIDFDIHTNHWLGVHGGALAALADAVMGITGASVGEVVQTLSFNINFISNLPGTGMAIVKSQVKHHGQTTMVIMAEMTDEQGKLLAAITTTMFIAGHFNEIPREW